MRPALILHHVSRGKYKKSKIFILRCVWPEGDAFGAADSEAEDDFMALREILFADLGVEHQAGVKYGDNQMNPVHRN